VQILDPLGNPLSAFGGGSGGGAAGGGRSGGAGPASALAGPTAIAAVDAKEPWSFRARDLVFVVDRGGRRIQSFTPDGARLHAFADSAAGGRSFAYLALDYYNNVYASDRRRSQIHKLDESLRPIATFGSRGTGDAQFIGPSGLAMWRRFGQMFVAESTGAQYYWVGTDVENLFALPDTIAAGATGVIAYALTEHSETEIDLLDRRGAIVRTLLRSAFQEPGARRVPWAAVADGGGPLAPARYRLRVRAAPTYSSKKHFRRDVETAIDVVAPRASPRETRAAPRGKSP
jgi:hypothetical protein